MALDTINHNQIFQTLYIYLVDAVTGSDMTTITSSTVTGRSVLLMEGTGVPGENHPPVASHCQTLSHDIVNCCKSNYHTMTTTTVLQ
jgi:hypothetical protein